MSADLVSAGGPRNDKACPGRRNASRSAPRRGPDTRGTLPPRRGSQAAVQQAAQLAELARAVVAARQAVGQGLDGGHPLGDGLRQQQGQGICGGIGGGLGHGLTPGGAVEAESGGAGGRYAGGYHPGMPKGALPPALRDHFDRPRNVGAPAGAQRRGEARNEACGDVVVVWLRVAGPVVDAAGFKAQGCPAALAMASAACDLLAGMQADGTLPERLRQAHAAAFGVPAAAHRHALALVVEAAGRAAGG